MSISELVSRWRAWPVASLVALACLYFATRYSAADDARARTAVIVSTAVLAVLALWRYLRRGEAVSKALLAACAVGLVATYLGRHYALPPFATLREAIAFAHVAVAAALFVAAGGTRAAAESMDRRGRLLLLLFAALGPALVQAGNNLSFLPDFMLAPYLLALVALGFAAYGVVLACDRSHSRGDLAALAAAFTLAVIFLPSLRAALRLDGKLLFDFFVLFAAVAWPMVALARRNHRFLVISLGIFAALQLGTVALALVTDDVPMAERRSKVPPEAAAAAAKETPNVYLLVYDGIPNFDTLRALGFDPSAHEQLFEKYGFKAYPGTYSLASTSLNSMARTLDMQEQLRWPEELAQVSPDRQGAFYQRIRGGYSTTHHLLKHLGYTTHGILATYLVGNISELDELLPKGTDPRLELGATLLRGVLQGEFRSDTKGWRRRAGSKYFVREKERLIKSAARPRFVESHILLPSHSPNTGRCRSNERELWRERYEQALGYMEQDFANIQAHDPGAIVIAMGDHGPDLTGEHCNGLQTYALADITHLDVLDRHATMLAVRWPDPARAARYDADVRINQDAFPTVFAYLYDSPLPLAWKVPREVSFEGHVFLRDGEFVPFRAAAR